MPSGPIGKSTTTNNNELINDFLKIVSFKKANQDITISSLALLSPPLNNETRVYFFIRSYLHSTKSDWNDIWIYGVGVLKIHPSFEFEQNSNTYFRVTEILRLLLRRLLYFGNVVINFRLAGELYTRLDSNRCS